MVETEFKPDFSSYINGILEGRTPEDIERELIRESEAERITRLEKQLSTNIVKVDYLKSSAGIVFPENVIDAIELNNLRIEWIEEKNKEPSRRGTRPVYVKDTERFLYDVKCASSSYIHEMMCTATTHDISQRLQYIFDKFLNFGEYDYEVEVNI